MSGARNLNAALAAVAGAAALLAAVLLAAVAPLGALVAAALAAVVAVAWS